MEPAIAFGRALRRRRTEAKLSQEKLALAADIERVYVSWLETGKRQPTFGMMLKISGALSCSAADLVAEAEAIVKAASENS